MFVGRSRPRVGLITLAGAIATNAIAVAALAACGPDNSAPAPVASSAAVELVAVGGTPLSATATSPLVDLGLRAVTFATDAVLAGPHYAIGLESVAVAGYLTRAQLTGLHLGDPPPATPQSTDPQSIGPQATGPQATGPQATGPQSGNTVSSGTVLSGTVPGGTGEAAGGLGSAGLRPTVGQEFLVVHAQDRLRSVGLLPPKGAAPAAAVVVAGRSRPVPGGVPPAGTVLLVSVPIGASASLAVTDAGRTQSIDLRTGNRAADADPLLYPQYVAAASLLDRVHVDGVMTAGSSPPISLDLAVTLRPYLNDRGWAPAGRVWLALDVTLTLPHGLALRLDLARGLTLRTDTTTLTIPAGTVLAGGTDPTNRAPAHWSYGFSVPAGLRRLAATFVATGVFSRPGSSTPLNHARRQVQNSAVTLVLSVRVEPPG